MDPRRQTTEKEEQAILELYKSHHSPHEVETILGISYGVITYRFKGFKMAKVPQYDRFDLIPVHNLQLFLEETLNESAASEA